MHTRRYSYDMHACFIRRSRDLHAIAPPMRLSLAALPVSHRRTARYFIDLSSRWWHFWLVVLVLVRNQVTFHYLLHSNPIHRESRQLIHYEFGLSTKSSSVLSAVAVELFSALIKLEMGLKFGFSASPGRVSATTVPLAEIGT